MGAVAGILNSVANVNVEGGGTLRGVGDVVFDNPATEYLFNNGTISVGGVYNPPYANPVGTLSVTGNYTQTGAGVLNLTIFNASDYDRLEVSGLATLAGTPTFSSRPACRSWCSSAPPTCSRW